MEMTPEKWGKLKVLFEAALERPAEERLRYVTDSDAEEDLQAEVLRLLSSLSEAGNFLEQPVAQGLASSGVDLDEGSFPPEKLLADRFKIIRFLAKGGMGEVYEAEDLELHEHVAIKAVRPELLRDPAALQRFKREIHLAKKVTHPNVCRVFDLFRHQVRGTAGDAQEDLIVVSMELLKGETLAARLRRGEHFTAVQAFPIVSQLAGALDAAHGVGVLHRDLKPGNIMLVAGPEPATPRAVITDFGLALRFGGEDSVSTESTRTRGILGTPAYMSPEQLEGRELTSATDLYALGLVLYEMVTGALPFASDTPLSSALRRLQDPVPSPRAKASDLPASWETGILRCLERDPAKRFSSARELVQALAGRAPRSSPSLAPGWRVWVPALAVLLALSVGVSFYAFRQHRVVPQVPQAPQLRPSVAVLGFKNLSGRQDISWLSTALAETIDAELGVGEKLRTVSQENVARMKNDLTLNDAESYAPDTLRRIRRNLGTDYVIEGAYLAIGTEASGQIRLDVRLQDTRTGETVASVVESGEQPRLNELFTKVGADLRGKLGVTAVSPQDETAAHASLPTSPEAGRFYAEGLDHLRKLNYLAARDSLSRAVALEPGFAMGHLALGVAYAQLYQDTQAKKEVQLASELSSNLSHEERLNVEARLREGNGERDRAVQIYRSLFDFFPDNVDYGLHLVNAQASAGKPKDALDTIHTLRALPAPQRDDPRLDLAEENADYLLGDFKNAYQLGVRAADKARQLESPALFARARHEQGSVLRILGDRKGAIAALQDAQQFYAKIGDRGALERVTISTGIVYMDAGDREKAKEELSQGLRMAEDLGDQYGITSAAHSLGNLLQQQGDLDGAKKYFDRALQSARAQNRKGAAAMILGGEATLLANQANLSESLNKFQEALGLAREVGDRQSIQYELYSLATLWLNTGKLPEADAAYLEAVDVARQMDSTSSLAADLVGRSGLLRAKGDLVGARKVLDEASKLVSDSADKSQAPWVHMNMAALEVDEDHQDTAQALAQQSMQEFQSQGDSDGEGAAAGMLARSFLAQNNVAQAIAAAHQAEAAAAKSHDQMNILDVAIVAARAEAADGKVSASQTRLKQLLAQAVKTGNVQSQFDARLALGEIEIHSQERSDGKTTLSSLQKDATAKGFLLIAKKAAALSAS
jgi:serine/threonine protein kinase/tetratricopeptide (TPR) repeat protein